MTNYRSSNATHGPDRLVDALRSSNIDARCRRWPPRAACALRPHAKTHKSPAIARWQIDARRGRHLLREGRRSGSVRRRGHRRHPAALSGQPGQRRPRARADGSRAHLDHRRSPGGRARLVGRDAARAGRTLDVLVKVDVGFHRCGIDPGRRPRSASSATSRRCPACGCAACSATPATRYHAASEDELRAIARAEAADRCASSRGGRRASRSTRSRVGATPTRAIQRCSRRASPSCGPATTSTSIARRSRSAPRRWTTAR